MKMIKDFSIHFTIKGQDISTIRRTFFESVFVKKLLDENNEKLQMHNCFLTRAEVDEKGFNTDVVDFLDEVCEDTINWQKAGDTLGMSRVYMIETVKRLKGVAIFIGEIKDGVEEEYKLALEIGTPIHIIALP